ncbi:MAG TPA: hypothetical protein VIA81_08465 [Acidimicrobiia bacterium]|jgi:hypothetical protein
MPFEGYFALLLVVLWALRVARRKRLTTEMVRRLSLSASGNYNDEVKQWMASQPAARWLVDAAYEAVKACPNTAAILFYNDVAERWNDEIGFAARSLIFTNSLPG